MNWRDIIRFIKRQFWLMAVLFVAVFVVSFVAINVINGSRAAAIAQWEQENEMRNSAQDGGQQHVGYRAIAKMLISYEEQYEDEVTQTTYEGGEALLGESGMTSESILKKPVDRVLRVTMPDVNTANQHAATLQAYVRSRAVLDPLMEQFPSDIPLADMAARVSVTTPTGTGVYNLGVYDEDPHKAQEMVEAMAEIMRQDAVTFFGFNYVKSAGEVELLQQAEIIPTAKSLGIDVNIVLAPQPAGVIDRSMQLLICLVLGLVVAVGVALLRKLMDYSVQTPDQLAEVSGLPALGLFSGRTTDAQWYVLGMNLMTYGQDGRRVVAFAGLNHKANRTAAAYKAGRAIATSEQRVLLIDADAYAPRLHGLLGLPNDTGWFDALERGARPEIRRVDDALDVITAGLTQGAPAAVINRGFTRAVLEELAGQYALILICAPAALQAPETIALAAIVDALVLWARAEVDTDETVIAARRSLALVDAPLPGIALYTAPRRLGLTPTREAGVREV